MWLAYSSIAPRAYLVQACVFTHEASGPMHTRDELTGHIHEFVDELNQCTVSCGGVHTEFVHKLKFVP